MATDVHAEVRPAASMPAFSWIRLLGSGAIVVLGSAASNVLSFLFTFVVARLLRPEDYAAITACLSLLVVVTVPALTLQLVAARYTAIWWLEMPGRAHALAAWLARAALLLGSVLAVGVLVLAGPIARYLHLATALPLVIIAGILLCSFLSPVYRGLLQGQHRFGRYAAATTSEFVVRLATGMALIVAGWRVAGALTGVLLGALASAVLGWSLAGHRERGRSVAIPVRAVLRWAMPTFLVQAALTALLYEDTLLAKHLFSFADAGAYAGLATTARVLVFISGALTMFMFPVVARAHEAGGRSRLVSHTTLAVITLVEAVLLIGCTAAPALALRLVVGSQYVAMSPYLASLALALAAYAIVNLLANYLLATGNRAFLLPLLAAPVAQVFLMYLFHGTLGEFVHTLDAVMLSTLAVLLGLYCWPSPRKVLLEMEVE